MEIVNIKSLSFTYSGACSAALMEADLNVHKGEFVVICGGTGSGKSTLLRLMKPVLAPAGVKSGCIRLFGRDVNELSDREQAEHIGFVAQDPESMIVTDKVWHELAFSLESLGKDKDFIRRRIAEIAEFFGFTEMLDRQSDELSGGQKQLLSLASALTASPDLLILDEPSARLDPIAAEQLFSNLSKINRELGTTVIVSEHRLDSIIPYADRLVCLEKGRFVCDLTVSEIGREKLTEQMLRMLPVPARVWFSCEGSGKCPVCVADGRKWLEECLKGKELLYAPETPPVSDVIALKVSHLCFRYGKNCPDVLNELSLTVMKGEHFGILGGNGVGKSTLSAVVCGLRKQYSGKVELSGKAVMLPQTPSSLFCRDTVYDDLNEMTDDKERISEVIALCELESLTDRHPFDLSGGEIQRAALAKLLLCGADILVLDEPSKGLDARSKTRLAAITASLCRQGATVITVSHDIEYIADNCTRCAMLFDGELIGTAPPKDFFVGNSFYTTAALRMSCGLVNVAVTTDDLIKALGYEPAKREKIHIPERPNKQEPESVSREKKMSPVKAAVRALSLGAFLFSALCCAEIVTVFKERAFVPYILLAASVLFLALAFTDGREVKHNVRSGRRPSAYSVAGSAVMLGLIPLTVHLGARYLDTGKYLFISLVVMLEASLPFWLLFEGRKPKAREIAAVSVLTASAVAGRIAFYMLPQFKPVLAVVIVSGAAFGSQTGFIVGSMSMLISNFMFGQGPWTPWQMFSMGICGFLAGVIFDKGILPMRREVIAICGFFSAVVIYGGIVNPSTLFIMHNEVSKASLAAAYAAGLPLDIIHGAATMGFLYALAPAVLKKLERLKVKYEFFV